MQVHVFRFFADKFWKEGEKFSERTEPKLCKNFCEKILHLLRLKIFPHITKTKEVQKFLFVLAFRLSDFYVKAR